MISEYFTMALKNMRKRRLRSLLTLLGILIAIATIFVLISLSIGLEQTIKDQFEELGADKFFVQPRGQLGPPGTEGAATLTEDDVDVLEKIPGVKEVSYWTIGNAKIEYKDEIRFVSTIGVDLERVDLYFESFTVDPEEGRVLKKGDTFDIVIGSQYKHNNFFSKPVELGDKITINDLDFKVRGIMEPIGNSPDDRLISMPEEVFRDLFEIPERIDAIVVQVGEGQDINQVAERSEKKLLNSRGLDEDTQDFTILTPEEVLESFGAILNIVTSFLLGVAAIALLVGGIGIMNTVYTSVLERTREIGVMKAIGAKNKDILLIFLIESGLLGLVGGMLGVVFGIVVVKGIEFYAIEQLGTKLLNAALPPALILGSLAFAFLIGSLSGIWPAWKATKIRPVEALRYE
jgi:putative ABC transport system permease protein